MKYLTEQDYVEIKKNIIAYNKLTQRIQEDKFSHYHQLAKKLKDKIDTKIDSAWLQAFADFEAACQKSSAWQDAYRYINDFEKVVSFDWDEHFQITVGDSESREHVYSPILDQEYADSYANVATYRQTINKKLTKLESKRFVIGKKLRMNFLKSKLENIETQANQYADCLQQQALKNKYLSERTQIYRSTKTKIEDLEKNYATQILHHDPKLTAMLACKQNKPEMTDSFRLNDVNYRINNLALIQVCDEIRDLALIEETHLQDYQQHKNSHLTNNNVTTQNI